MPCSLGCNTHRLPLDPYALGYSRVPSLELALAPGTRMHSRFPGTTRPVALTIGEEARQVEDLPPQHIGPEGGGHRLMTHLQNQETKGRVTVRQRTASWLQLLHGWSHLPGRWSPFINDSPLVPPWPQSKSQTLHDSNARQYQYTNSRFYFFKSLLLHFTFLPSYYCIRDGKNRTQCMMGRGADKAQCMMGRETRTQ